MMMERTAAHMSRSLTPNPELRAPNSNLNPSPKPHPHPNQGFAPNFAALTFPSCSSAVAALQYAADPRADAAAPRGLAPGARVALQFYAVALALLTLTVVLLVLVGFVIHVARHGGDGSSHRLRAAEVVRPGRSVARGAEPALVELSPALPTGIPAEVFTLVHAHAHAHCSRT